MAIAHDDMEKILKNTGCRTIHKVKKVIEYMLPDTKIPFYMHVENNYPQLVILPALEVFLDTLSEVNGVITKPPYYHNADMVRFPKRLHEGEKEIHYGLAFEFDNNSSLQIFIHKLIEIVAR